MDGFKKNASRSEYVFRNTTVSILMQIAKNLIGFISRTIFIKVLGSEYLGVNSLFGDVLSMLSFAELGIGNAMVFSLYKPLAEKDEEKIKSLMKLYARCYQVIGIVIAVLGLCVIPFLDYIVGDVSHIRENTVALYLLFLLNSVLSYFFTYKKSLIIADQKNYIVEIYQEVFYALQVVIQSVFLIVAKEFIWYLIIVIIFTFLNNFFVAKKADKLYPCLKDRRVQKLENNDLKSIVHNVKALVVYKIGSVLIDSTDSIFISMFINVVTVGLYANYKIVVSIFKTIGSTVNNSIIASVGNLNAVASDKKKYSVFLEMLYVDAWFYGYTAVALCVFLSEFIFIWLGEGFALSFSSVLAICILYYISNVHYPCYIYRTTAGLFVFSQYVPLIAAVINIILDVVMGRSIGLAGIIWASIIARSLTYEVIDPFIIYKRVFQENPLKYYVRYIVYGFIIVTSGLAAWSVTKLVPVEGVLGFIVKCVVLSIMFNAIFFSVTFRTKEFRSLRKRVINMVHLRI